MTKEIKKPETTLVAVRRALETEAPLHQMMGEVLEEVGGIDFLVNWAEDNPSAFVNILMKLAPPKAVSQGPGSMHLHVDMPNGLTPGALDVVDEQ